MIFQFLGTSAGKPTKKRNVSGIVFRMFNESEWYLFDCGEATQHQLLHTSYSLYTLSKIFITHLHGDHIYGLFGLITSRMLENAETSLVIYGPKGLKKIIESVVDISEDHLGYKLDIVEVYGGYEEKFERFKIKVLPLIHSIESYAYYIEENPKIVLNIEKLKSDGLMPSFYYQDLKNQKDVIYNNKLYKASDYTTIKSGKRVIIAGDNAEPDFIGKYLKNLDLLIHEATYTDAVFQNLETKYLHTTAKNLAITSQNFNVKNLIATHISPRFSEDEILNELKKYYSGNVYVANDFDVFELRETLKKITV